MGRYVRIILFDALMAAVIVALYSPSMLALRPTDPSLLRAGLSVFLGILIAASLVWVNASALREPKVHMLEGDGAIDVDEVREVLNTCVSDRSVGRFARDGLRELDEANNISGLLLDKIANKFGEGSMTYDRYASVVQGAHNAIISNTATMANRAQAFDGQGYRQLSMKLLNGKYKADGLPDDVQEEKHALYESSLAEMAKTIDANERLLLELDHLSAELSDENDDDDGQQRLDEIRQLSDQLKWYREDN